MYIYIYIYIFFPSSNLLMPLLWPSAWACCLQCGWAHNVLHCRLQATGASSYFPPKETCLWARLSNPPLSTSPTERTRKYRARTVQMSSWLSSKCFWCYTWLLLHGTWERDACCPSYSVPSTMCCHLGLPATNLDLDPCTRCSCLVRLCQGT